MADKFNMMALLSQRSKDYEENENEEFINHSEDIEVVYIPLNNLVPSKDNFYNVDNKIEELKMAIDVVGILQPLVVVKKKGSKNKYDIVSGHRRRLALMQLVDEGKEKFENVPCIVREETDYNMEKLALIMANRYRDKTDWERMTEIVETEHLVRELKKQQGISGSTRNILSEIVNCSPAQLAKYKAIHNNLSDELMFRFRENVFGVSIAYELSGLGEEYQKRAMFMLNEKLALTLPEVKNLKLEEKENAPIPGQMEIGEIIGEQPSGDKGICKDIPEKAPDKKVASNSKKEKLAKNLADAYLQGYIDAFKYGNGNIAYVPEPLPESMHSSIWNNAYEKYME